MLGETEKKGKKNMKRIIKHEVNGERSHHELGAGGSVGERPSPG